MYAAAADRGAESSLKHMCPTAFSLLQEKFPHVEFFAGKAISLLAYDSQVGPGGYD